MAKVALLTVWLSKVLIRYHIEIISTQKKSYSIASIRQHDEKLMRIKSHRAFFSFHFFYSGQFFLKWNQTQRVTLCFTLTFSRITKDTFYGIIYILRSMFYVRGRVFFPVKNEMRISFIPKRATNFLIFWPSNEGCWEGEKALLRSLTSICKGRISYCFA